MKRRDFLKTMLLAGSAFMILPGAGRIWKAVRCPKAIVNPDYVNAEYEQIYYFEDGSLVLANRNLLDWNETKLFDSKGIEVLTLHRRFKLKNGVFVEVYPYILV